MSVLPKIYYPIQINASQAGIILAAFSVFSDLKPTLSSEREADAIWALRQLDELKQCVDDVIRSEATAEHREWTNHIAAELVRAMMSSNAASGR